MNLDLYKHIELVFQDIDGCLEDETGEPYPINGKSVLNISQKKYLKNLGLAIDASHVKEVVINTGRSFSDTIDLVKCIGSSKIGLLVLEHGGVIFDLRKDSLLDSSAFAIKNNEPIIGKKFEELSEIKKIVSWFRGEGVSQLGKVLACDLSILPKELNVSFEIPENKTGKDVIVQVEQLVRKALPHVDYEKINFCYNHTYIDIIGALEKSDGARLVLKMLGVKEENTCAIGDHINDYSIFDMLDFVYCPSNAYEGLKEKVLEKNCLVSEKAFGHASLDFYKTFVK